MEKINLYIDFDGVILDTINPLYQKLKEDNVPDEKVKEFFTNYDWEKIINDKYIINDSISCIQKIIDSEKFNLAILTHINSLHEAELKIKYLRKYFKDKVFNTIIPRLVKLVEAPSHGKPIIEYDPKSKGALAYLNLAKEVIERNGK